MPKKVWLQWMFCFSLLVVAGCDEALTVSGRVEYRSEPVQEGVVQFVPDEGRPVSTEVANGSYRITEGLTPGTYLVRLYAYEETGRMLRNPDDPTKEDPEVVAILPRKYNQRSSLKVNLLAGENNENFDLK